jgi:integrase
VLHPACVAAGIEELRWHDLRHFFASICLELFGADFHRITTLMGHKSISTTRELYGHWIDDEARDGTDAAKFGAKLWN